MKSDIITLDIQDEDTIDEFLEKTAELLRTHEINQPYYLEKEITFG